MKLVLRIVLLFMPLIVSLAPAYSVILIPAAALDPARSFHGWQASFTPRGGHLIVVQKDWAVKIYSAFSFQESATAGTGGSFFFPDADTLLVCGDNSFFTYDLQSMKPRSSFKGGHISFGPGGRIAGLTYQTGADASTQEVWIMDTITGQLVHKVPGWGAKFSPAGDLMSVNRLRISTWSAANEVQVYDTRTWRIVETLEDFSNGFTSDGRYLLISHPHKPHWRYYDTQTWRRTDPPQGVSRSAEFRNNVLKSPDGRWNIEIDRKTDSIRIRDARLAGLGTLFAKGELETTGEFESRLRKWEQAYSIGLSVGPYDADRGSFDAKLLDSIITVAVPREKARDVLAHRDRLRIEGTLKYHGGQYVELGSAAVIDEISGERFAAVLPAAHPPAPPAPAKVAAGAGDSIRDISGLRPSQRANDFAVVIGIESYQGIPGSDYSKRDAELVRIYLKALGMPERNIDFITDERATLSGITKSVEAWLPNRAKRGSRIFIYYSGHGAPDPATGDAYLVPYDGDPNYLSVTGYPLKRLYARLQKVHAGEVIVVLDSCFSGAGGRSVLAKGARPLVLVNAEPNIQARNMVVMSATQSNQISTSSPEKKHGIFTYYFLKAIQTGYRNPADIYARIKPQVEDEAKMTNVRQSPSMNPPPDRARKTLHFFE
jgi:hypothetical protein